MRSHRSSSGGTPSHHAHQPLHPLLAEPHIQKALLATLALSLTVNALVFFTRTVPRAHEAVVLWNRARDSEAPQQYDLWGAVREHAGPGNALGAQQVLIPPRDRDDLGKFLESLGGFHVGVELGVQAGRFARTLLRTWPSCTRYYLVDLWAQQDNYNDLANVDNRKQDKNLGDAQAALAPWEDKTVYVRNYTTSAAQLIPDDLDFVYVDARHDYCGALEDIVTYWPKIRPGGILAGHDYRAASEVWPEQDWSLCMDGTRHPEAVMGAVNEFALKHGLTVAVTYGSDEYRTWLIRKPLAGRLQHSDTSAAAGDASDSHHRHHTRHR